MVEDRRGLAGHATMRAFIEDRWERDPGNPSAGYGITRVLEGGRVLEKAAANVSIVRGQLTEARAKAMSARQGRQLAAGAGYFAGALSLVFHSAHPLIPTFRSDIRYFQVDGQNGWFGGGADLTPSYLFPSDISEFHAFYRTICERYHPALYPAAKAQCDSYFYLPARREHRGVGGIFFDDLDAIPPPTAPLALAPAAATAGAAAAAAGDGADEEGFERAHGFSVDVARGFMDSFWPIVERRRGLAFTEDQRHWQLVRRGRYLEFNLLYDRGVKFGMDGSGRVESIMVSAPPLIAWRYNVQPQPGSPEEELVKVLKAPVEWA
ncbi:unnamed protein product [Closterium sp. Yama58-4]|nr:unnamed protein product [Closterium sp. Yama58-4]